MARLSQAVIAAHSPYLLQVVCQRGPMDCGVSCLAMICGVSYENALCAVAQVQPNVCVKGLYFTEMIKAAKLLGVKLKQRKAADLELDTGILSISAPKWKTDHVVVLKSGLIVDTDGTIWDADVFISANNAKVGLLLVVGS